MRRVNLAVRSAGPALPMQPLLFAFENGLRVVADRAEHEELAELEHELLQLVRGVNALDDEAAILVAKHAGRAQLQAEELRKGRWTSVQRLGHLRYIRKHGLSTALHFGHDGRHCVPILRVRDGTPPAHVQRHGENARATATWMRAP
eukprot:scaffold4944_cov209-Pinguiococcus_pyrenoidosus.AAC.2